MRNRRGRKGLVVAIASAAAAIVASSVAPYAADAAPNPRSVQSGRGWVDFNGDGTGDYCRRVGNAWDLRVQCTVSNGGGYGDTFTSSAMDTGYDAGRAWADFNGDGKADFCRVVDDWGLRVRCTVSTGTGFGTTFSSASLDPGYDAGRAWADANGDGRADYCRIVDDWGLRARCTLSTGGGFGATISSSGAFDPGYDAGRAWADVTGDGKADYCRVVGGWYKNVSCTPSTGSGFGTTFTSGALDAGYDAGRAWMDVTGDRKADYCRVIDNWGLKVQCTPSTGWSFGATFTSSTLDPGYDAGRAWTDANADGRADYCRVVDDWGRRVRCTFSTGNGFGGSVSSTTLDVGYDIGRAWTDFNNDNRADYCRSVGDGWNPRVECTMSTGAGFGLTYTSPILDWGYEN